MWQRPSRSVVILGAGAYQEKVDWVGETLKRLPSQGLNVEIGAMSELTPHIFTGHNLTSFRNLLQAGSSVYPVSVDITVDGCNNVPKMNPDSHELLPTRGLAPKFEITRQGQAGADSGVGAWKHGECSVTGKLHDASGIPEHAVLCYGLEHHCKAIGVILIVEC